MKIRTGFVSNSSASSFCIYGWSSDQLIDHLTRDNPFLRDVNIDVDEYQFFKNFQELCKNNKKLEKIATYTYDRNGNIIIGIGETADEFDHYYGEDWEEYECDPPSLENTRELDKLVEELKLPKPGMFLDTWFNG